MQGEACKQCKDTIDAGNLLILDFRKFIFLTPRNVTLRGVTYFADISAKTNFLSGGPCR